MVQPGVLVHLKKSLGEVKDRPGAPSAWANKENSDPCYKSSLVCFTFSRKEGFVGDAPTHHPNTMDNFWGSGREREE